MRATSRRSAAPAARSPALIDEILDFSKIEAGRLELVSETFDLKKLVESVVELLAPQAQGKGLEISASIAAGAPRIVVGDGLRLRQALTNLAGNAVKFTERGGVGVELSLADDGRVRFQVKDTGPGVPPDRRAAIFEDFEQGDGSNARHYEGTGLGLAIAKRIVALMGGELTLADNPGGGSIFAFAVALPAAANAPEESAPKALGRPPRADRRQFAVRGAGDRRPAGRGGRDRRARRWARRGPHRAGERRPPRPRHRRLRARRRIDQPPRPRRARRRRAEGAGAVLAVRTARLRPGLAQRFRRLAGQAGSRAVALRAARQRICARRGAAPPAAVPSARRGRTKRALLAEDNDINALVAQKALRRLGFEVERARDGEAGVASRARRVARGGAAFRRRADGHQDAGRRRPRGGAAHPQRRSRGEGAARRDRRADRQRHDRRRRRRDRGGVRRVPRQAGRDRAARSDDRGPARGAAAGRRRASACHKSVRQE